MMLDRISVLLLQAGAAGEAPARRLAEAMGLAAGSLGLLALLATLLVVKAGVIGMALWLDRAYPRVSLLAYERYRTQGRRCFWIGLVNLVLGLLLVLFLVATQVLAILGLLLLALIALVALFGATSAYRHLGVRMLPQAPEMAPWPLFVGALTAEAAFFVPVLGQVFLLGVVIRGFGAAVMALLAARRAPAEPATAPAVTAQ